jgi:hypothetical protein
MRRTSPNHAYRLCFKINWATLFFCFVFCAFPVQKCFNYSIMKIINLKWYNNILWLTFMEKLIYPKRCKHFALTSLLFVLSVKGQRWRPFYFGVLRTSAFPRTASVKRATNNPPTRGKMLRIINRVARKVSIVSILLAPHSRLWQLYRNVYLSSAKILTLTVHHSPLFTTVHTDTRLAQL